MCVVLCLVYIPHDFGVLFHAKQWSQRTMSCILTSTETEKNHVIAIEVQTSNTDPSNRPTELWCLPPYFIALLMKFNDNQVIHLGYTCGCATTYFLNLLLSPTRTYRKYNFTHQKGQLADHNPSVSLAWKGWTGPPSKMSGFTTLAHKSHSSLQE